MNILVRRNRNWKVTCNGHTREINAYIVNDLLTGFFMNFLMLSPRLFKTILKTNTNLLI